MSHKEIHAARYHTAAHMQPNTCYHTANTSVTKQNTRHTAKTLYDHTAIRKKANQKKKKKKQPHRDGAVLVDIHEAKHAVKIALAKVVSLDGLQRVKPMLL